MFPFYQTTEAVDAALRTGQHVSDLGMMAVTAGFFLVLSSLLMIACFRWFMKMVNEMMKNQKQLVQNQQDNIREMVRSQQDSMKQLLEETRSQNAKLSDISEGLMPETLLRVKTLSNTFFDLSCEKVILIIDRIRNENHIANKEATHKKVIKMLTNIHEERNSKFDSFHYRGRKLSSYTNNEWIDSVAEVVEGEIYHAAGENDERARTNVKAAYENIKLDFYHRITD